jgi:hypothetical protein
VTVYVPFSSQGSETDCLVLQETHGFKCHPQNPLLLCPPFLLSWTWWHSFYLLRKVLEGELVSWEICTFLFLVQRNRTLEMVTCSLCVPRLQERKAAAQAQPPWSWEWHGYSWHMVNSFLTSLSQTLGRVMSHTGQQASLPPLHSPWHKSLSWCCELTCPQRLKLPSSLAVPEDSLSPFIRILHSWAGNSHDVHLELDLGALLPMRIRDRITFNIPHFFS